MNKRNFLSGAALTLVVVAAIGLTGCDSRPSEPHAPEQFNTRAGYFDGSVAVEYRQVRRSRSNDFVSVTFYAPGTYQVSFSTPPGSSSGKSSYMPKDFTIQIGNTPREIVINQYLIPDFLRVTVTKDGGTGEFHDFM